MTTSSPAPMSTSYQTFHIEQLASNILHLDLEGTKWALFTMHFWKAMIAFNHWGHFDSSDPCLVAKNLDHPTIEEQKKIWQWTYEDWIMEYLLD
jgi:hypothetical protein